MNLPRGKLLHLGANVNTKMGTARLRPATYGSVIACIQASSGSIDIALKLFGAIKASRNNPLFDRVESAATSISPSKPLYRYLALGCTAIGPVFAVASPNFSAPGSEERYATAVIALYKFVLGFGLSIIGGGQLSEYAEDCYQILIMVEAFVNYSLMCSAYGLQINADNAAGVDDTVDNFLGLMASTTGLLSDAAGAAAYTALTTEDYQGATIFLGAQIGCKTCDVGCAIGRWVNQYEKGIYPSIADAWH